MGGGCSAPHSQCWLQCPNATLGGAELQRTQQGALCASPPWWEVGWSHGSSCSLQTFWPFPWTRGTDPSTPAGFQHEQLQPARNTEAEVTGMFKDFLIRFNRTYRSPEEQRRRFGIFTRNLLAARRLQETELGTGQYGVTRFSDWTDEEFRGMFRSPAPPPMRRAPRLLPGKLPQSCDWRKAGAVTAVKNQGRECRSCWAFAAVSNIESLWNIHFHQPRNLSVQEVLDCSWCGVGCSGGFVWDAFTTVLRMGGLTSNADYPYEGKEEKCQHEDQPAAYIEGFEMLPRDEEEIAAHLATCGSVTVTLNSALMKHYEKGISQPSVMSCNPDQVDHVALLVGYGRIKSTIGSSRTPGGKSGERRAITVSIVARMPVASPSFL
ncbi:cathepsin W-like isoform X2 [Emydura macquarii macquarii]|uniref:cathepsin W-like isoform X2 n=1 Tax=Emydura macquarii macquarii TaxID=1129001 RepID=UPI00352BB121